MRKKNTAVKIVVIFAAAALLFSALAPMFYALQ
jgi:hypothetical protein